MNASPAPAKSPISIDAGRANPRPRGTSVLARLLHALNQPVTGLQCSLELMMAAPRRPDEYAEVLAEGIQLTNRVRELVGAMREVIEIQESTVSCRESFRLRDLLAETVEDLRPVAQSRGLRIEFDCAPAISAGCERRFFAGLIFRILDSLLNLGREQSTIGIRCTEGEEEIQLIFRWDEMLHHRGFEFSRAELGLLLAESACEQIGGRSKWKGSGEQKSYSISFPRAAVTPPSKTLEDAE
jgi:hypothetical protein